MLYGWQLRTAERILDGMARRGAQRNRSLSRGRGSPACGLLPTLALAILLALAGAGCQTGGRARASGGAVSSSAPARTVSAPARTVSAPARTASVPAPAGGGTYAAIFGGASGCPSGGVPAALRRPIHLPHIAAGARCPISPPGRKVDPSEAAALGPGPIYL